MSADITTLICEAENGVDKEHWSHATENDLKFFKTEQNIQHCHITGEC
jgi:hypothetical protein